MVEGLKDSTYTGGKSRNVSASWVEMGSYSSDANQCLPFSTARRYFMLCRFSGVGRFSFPMVDITS